MTATIPSPRTRLTAAPAAGERTDPAVWVLAVYVVLKMFYLAKSGLPQPADLMIVALAPFVLRFETLRALLHSHTFLILFVAWVVLSNAAWTAFSTNLRFLVFSLYYVFNFLVLALAFQAWRRNGARTARILAGAVAVSALIQLGATIAGGGLRASGTFNNPNQLAYWAVCSTCIYLFARRGRPTLLDFGVIGCLAYLALASLSRAGLASILVMLTVWTVREARKAPRLFLGAGAATLFLAAVVAATSGPQIIARLEVVSRFEERLRQHASTDELANRNYDRLIEHPEYLAFGAGEGDYSRFSGGENAIEIHSTIANLLFSYGLVGLALFVGFVALGAFRIGRRDVVFLLPLFLYGLTHNGIRFSFAWMLLGVLLGAAMLPRAARRDGALTG